MGGNSSKENSQLNTDSEESMADANDDAQATQDHRSSAESNEWLVYEGRHAVYHIQKDVSLPKDQQMTGSNEQPDSLAKAQPQNGPNDPVSPSVKKPASVSSTKTVRSEMSLRNLKE